MTINDPIESMCLQWDAVIYNRDRCWNIHGSFKLLTASTSCLVIEGARFRRKIEHVLCNAFGLGLVSSSSCVVSTSFSSDTFHKKSKSPHCLDVWPSLPLYTNSQTCIKRSLLGQKKWLYKTVDLLNEVQFIWNFLWQDKKNVTF
jgi:hypothetical protein